MEQLKVIFLCLDCSTNSSLIFIFFFPSFIVIKIIKDSGGEENPTNPHETGPHMISTIMAEKESLVGSQFSLK